MTRQNGEQPTRRLTVAELLAQHGKADVAGGGGRRHRRRAPEDDADAELTTTAPQEIIDRIHAEQPGVDWNSRRSNGHGVDPALDTPTRATPKAAPRSAPPPPPPVAKPAPPVAQPAKPQPPKPAMQPPPMPPQAAAPAAAPQAPRWQRPPERNLHERKAPERKPPDPEMDAIVDRLNGSRQSLAPVPPPPAPRRPLRHAEPMTDEFATVGEETDLAEDLEYEDEYDEYGYDDVDVVEDEDLDEPQLLTHDDDAEAPEEAERTPGQEWLAVGAQLALGVVGGAAVWLLFNWLWNSLPAVALAAALVVTAGLVWIVRNIRKAEDMQSTVLAVLVGLVVTVSPAALLLLSR